MEESLEESFKFCHEPEEEGEERTSLIEESLEKSFKFCPVTGIAIPSKDVSTKEKLPHMKKHMEWVSQNSHS